VDRPYKHGEVADAPRWLAGVATLAVSVATVVVAVKLERYWERLGKEFDPFEGPRGKVTAMRDKYERQSAIAREVNEVLREITGGRFA
jgi:hypothetical protein